MYNPRWPHTFSVYTQSLDARGLPVTDDEGNPVDTKMTLKQVAYDSQWNPRRNPDGTFKYTEVTDMPWGYRTATGGIKDSGDIFKADYKISCPMMLSHLPEGTVIVLTDYDNTFHAVVKKQTTYNWGTNIWLDDPGNNAVTPTPVPPEPPTPTPAPDDPDTPDNPDAPAEGGDEQGDGGEGE